LDLPDKDGYTPVMVALNNGNEQEAELLLDQGVDPSQSLHGFTLLHAAAATGLFDFAERLLTASGSAAQVDSLDGGGRTPLHWAAQEGHARVVEVLLAHGADSNAIDADGFCPLSQSAGEGSLEVARVLIEHGAQVNPRDERCAEMPLILAVAWEHEEMVELLLSHGARPDCPDKSGCTALSQAKECGNKHILAMLSAACDG
jgi:ankyrin repeat protein